MTLTQIIECLSCGKKDSWPYDRVNPVDPWDKWPDGCPECGSKLVDLTVILVKEK